METDVGATEDSDKLLRIEESSDLVIAQVRGTLATTRWSGSYIAAFCCPRRRSLLVVLVFRSSCRTALCEQQRLLVCLLLRSSLRRAAAAPPLARSWARRGCSRSWQGSEVVAHSAGVDGAGGGDPVAPRMQLLLGGGHLGGQGTGCCCPGLSTTSLGLSGPVRMQRRASGLPGAGHSTPNAGRAMSSPALDSSQWVQTDRSANPGDTCISRRRRAVAYRSLLVVFVG